MCKIIGGLRMLYSTLRYKSISEYSLIVATLSCH